MKDDIHPIFVLILVLVLGIMVWPWLRFHGVVPKGTLSDGVAVAALIGGYYFYKNWYDGRRKKK